MNVKIKQAYECTKCNKVYLDESLALKCCMPNLCSCGRLTKYNYYTKCGVCSEETRYKKANKIKYKDYKGVMIFDPTSEEFFSEYEELLDYHACSFGEVEKPKWAYGCESHLFRLNIDNMIESECENMWDDFDPEYHLKDLSDLYHFMEDWNDKQSARSYYKDYNIIVEFD